VDRPWAEWIAWVLEEAGYRVLIQAWDFVPGTNWIQRMQDGTLNADRTIAVLSEAYVKSAFAGAEWQAAWAADPAGADRKLLIVRIADCARPGLLGGVVDVDLFGVTETDARDRLFSMIEAAQQGRNKPPTAPGFPGANRVVPDQPGFPGITSENRTANWSDAIAAVIDSDGNTQGTAFFVGSDVALTCLHVLAAAGKQHGRLKPAGQRTEEVIVGVDCDEDLGLALVQVQPSPGRRWLALGDQPAVTGQEIHSKGFPQDHPRSKYPDGFPMNPARISGEARPDRQRINVLVLDAKLHRGMSGAPAVDPGTDAVVGVLRVDDDEEFALAVPAGAVKRRWPGLPLSTDGPPSAFADLALAMPWSVASGGWEEFDPGSLHCTVVGSESLAGGGPQTSLASLVDDMLSSREVHKLWRSFRGAWQGRELLRSGPRVIPADYRYANVRVASFDVADAFHSRASIERAVRLVVQSDLALFDVTGFEPGIMLLLGIRAATRRGVTINSHGKWLEGHYLDRPFNLSDLSLSSHTPPQEGPYVGDDSRIDRLIKRVRTGFDQLAHQPHYLDLPVYDALRQLGAQENAWVSIPIEKQVLMLCSYGKGYFEKWEALRKKIRSALHTKDIRTEVARLQDLASPQLVSQSLYERIRRCAGCVADWTGASPSTFFELGVRLAVSQWSVVQIADETWLRDATSEVGEKLHHAKQIARMQALLNPLVYNGEDDADIGSRIAQQLIEIRGGIKSSRGHWLRQVAAEALCPAQEQLPKLPGQLVDEADALDHKDRVRDNVPQALFYEIPEINRDYEKAALERRLAAWLYLEHRVHAAQFDDADQRKHVWRELGKIVASDLYLSDDDADQALADEITQRLT